MTGSRDEVRELNAEIVEKFYAGASVNTLAKTYGRSPSMIHKLIGSDRLANGPRQRVARPEDPRIMAEKKPLTKRHTWIGIQISRYKAEHDLSPTAFGMLIGASRVVVRNMEIGAHDLTLTQIDKLSEVMGIPFDTLVTPGFAPVTMPK